MFIIEIAVTLLSIVNQQFMRALVNNLVALLLFIIILNLYFARKVIYKQILQFHAYTHV